MKESKIVNDLIPEYVMIIREKQAKAIISKSAIYEYVINPYVGCGFGCSYCYAKFMKRFTGHSEPWGEFVDVKVNAPELLEKEVVKKPVGRVWISGVCDPYQPLEKKFELTRRCIEILGRHNWPFTIQTKSPLVTRDIDLLRGRDNVEAGFTVTTGDDSIRRLFEPNAPPVKARIKALAELHGAGITTYAMIAPMLPGAEKLGAMLQGIVDYVLVDRMNYHNADRIYKENGLTGFLSEDFFNKTGKQLYNEFTKQGLKCEVVFQ
jgi:DNA repair photolyase